MEILTPGGAWKATYPGAMIGLQMLEDVVNLPQHAGLEQAKTGLEERLRQRYAALSRAELKATPPLDAYGSYYRRFDKTYHVLLQLESIVHKGKAISSAGTLVEAMFMAELDNLLLTAAHDLDTVQMPLKLDAAQGDETYLLANGQEQTLKPGDIFMADGGGVICSILYGSDQRTRITPATRRVLFVVYVPPGVEAARLEKHLEDLYRHVRLTAPQTRLVLQQVVHSR